MTSARLAIEPPLKHSSPGVGLLDRERIIAKPGFNRWLVPPAALAIHLCIGVAYGFSVFWNPLSQAIGVNKRIACPEGAGLMNALFTTSCDWARSDLTWMYQLFFLFLGCSAALWGGWLERSGPRKAGVVAAVCWCGGLFISAFGISIHQLWLMWLGSGVIGGIGLGIGYITPVSTLIKWFPDRRGMATGMAIMGFGGGAMIGSPLAALLMKHFKTPTSVGVSQTFVVLGVLYLVYMLAGAFGYRVPPAGWKPDADPAPKASAAYRTSAKAALVTTRHVHIRDAHKTVQFWLIWAVLFLNVTAGIGVLGVASPMLQDIFGNSLVGAAQGEALTAVQKTELAGIAAAFVGLLSLFNILGRFFWASLSDKIGRKATYATFFLLGIALYAASPWAAHAGSKALFVAFMCIIISMYGGGFSTVPAYLADVFGTQFVSAIHGRLLTAWSAAGIAGPWLMTYISDAQRNAGVPRAQAYDRTLYILVGLLAVGFVANLLVRPLGDKWFMKDEEVAALQVRTAPTSDAPPPGSSTVGGGGIDGKVTLAWLAVGIPLLWGVWMTVRELPALVHG